MLPSLSYQKSACSNGFLSNTDSNILFSITTKNCKHLVIDAGHIAIESELVDKEAIRAIHLKRNQKYSDEDYKQLESLMYDKLNLRLEAAQVVLMFVQYPADCLIFSTSSLWEMTYNHAARL
jgi:Vacuolar protein sorting-associated protein